LEGNSEEAKKIRWHDGETEKQRNREGKREDEETVR